MHYLDIIKSVFELFLIYSVLVLINDKNKITALRLLTLFSGMAIILIVINYFELNFHMIFTSLACIIGFDIAIKRDFKLVIPDLIIAIIACSFLELVVLNIARLISSNLTFQTIVEFGFLVILILVIMLLSKRKVLDQILILYYQPYKFRILIVFVLLLMLLIVFSHTWNVDPKLFMENQKIVFLILLILMVFLGIFIRTIISQTYLKRYVEREFMYKEYENKKIEDLKTNEHDLYSKIQSLYSIANNCKDAECKVELKKWLSRIDNKKVNISRIGSNTVIASLLYDKQQAASYVGVRLEYSLDKNMEYNIQEHDLDRMLSNLLDNAIEYTAGLNAYRYKKVVKVETNKTTIIISNPVDGNITSQDLDQIKSDSHYSTKGHDRGYGLISVKALAAKNGLIFDIDIDDNIFTAAIDFISEDAALDI